MGLQWNARMWISLHLIEFVLLFVLSTVFSFYSFMDIGISLQPTNQPIKTKGGDTTDMNATAISNVDTKILERVILDKVTMLCILTMTINISLVLKLATLRRQAAAGVVKQTVDYYVSRDSYKYVSK